MYVKNQDTMFLFLTVSFFFFFFLIFADLNEQLMKMLMERDELHMKRDSFLVDIEDLTAFL